MERSLRAVPDASAENMEDDVADDNDPVSLGDAAADALTPTGEELELSGEQQALIPACRVKFTGMAWDSLDEVPALKTTMKFMVTAQITGHTQQVMKDGELREFANAEVREVKVVE